MHTPTYDCHCAILEIHDGRLYLPAMNLKYQQQWLLILSNSCLLKLVTDMESTIFVMQSFERALVSQFSQKTTEQQEDWRD